jgi:MFS family permease
MASDPAGSLIGGYVWGRWVPDRLRDRIVRLLCVLAGIPLVLCVLSPGLVTSMILFAVTGMLVTAAIVHSNITYTLQFPDKLRAQGAGLFSSGLWTAQGLGALAAGGLADWIGPVATLAVAGAGGALVGIPIAVAWKPAHAASGQSDTA